MDICIHIQCFDDRNGLKECSDLLKDIKIITEQRALYYTDISFYEVKKLDDTKTNAWLFLFFCGKIKSNGGDWWW